jgi:hypothetical protein
MPFDHKVYFDDVRHSLFSGSLSQEQVDGQEAILSAWEHYVDTQDIRWLAYILATTYHETSQEMMPIEEYGKGAGQPYGVKDAETGQTYYGRGYVQLTWRDNYARADKELALEEGNSCEWYAINALGPDTSARITYLGMKEGWFRSDSQGEQTLERYFNDKIEDPYGAREIVNGDKTTVPSWSNGVSIGNLIAGYYQRFLTALRASRIEPPAPVPERSVGVSIIAPADVTVVVTVNGEEVS